MVELTVVIAVLGILATVALPRFHEFQLDARRARFDDLNGRLQSSLGNLRLAYELGETAGLPTDADNNGAPDHLGDLSSSEPTIFDALLDMPVQVESNGWKPLGSFAFPAFSRLFIYHYDFNSNGILEVGSEAYFIYDLVTGNLTFRNP